MLHTIGIAAILLGTALILCGAAIFMFTDSKNAFFELRSTEVMLPDEDEDESPVINDLYYDTHAKSFREEEPEPHFVHEEEEEAPEESRIPALSAIKDRLARGGGKESPQKVPSKEGPKKQEKPSAQEKGRETAPLIREEPRYTEPLQHDDAQAGTEQAPPAKERWTEPLVREAEENASETKPEAPLDQIQKQIEKDLQEMLRTVDRVTEPLIRSESEPWEKEGDRWTEPLVKECADAKKQEDRVTEPLIMDEPDTKKTEGRVTEPLIRDEEDRRFRNDFFGEAETRWTEPLTFTDPDAKSEELDSDGFVPRSSGYETAPLISPDRKG